MVVATTRVACNTSTGTQDITTSDLGGLTPKAAIVIVSTATTDGTLAADIALSRGLTDGTNSCVRYGFSQDAQASSSTYGGAAASYLVQIPVAGGGNDALATFSSWLTNGIQINWTDAPSSAWLLTVIFFAGSDISTFVGNSVSVTNAVDTAHDITEVGFEPDVVIFPTDNSNGSMNGWGFTHNNRAGTVTQWSWFTKDRTARTTTEAYSMIRAYGGCLSGGAYNSDANCWLEMSAFDSSGFTATTRNAAPGSGDVFYYLAIKGNAATDFKVYNYSTPTSTGSATDNGAGFQPQAILYGTTVMEATETYYSDGLAGVGGLSVITANAQYSHISQTEDAAADSNTGTLTDNQAFNVLLHDQTAGVVGTYSSFGASGVNLSFSTVTGTAKVWPALAFKASAGGAYTLAVDAASVTASMTAISPLYGRNPLVVDAASVATSLTAISPLYGRKLVVDSAASSASMTSITPLWARVLNVDASSTSAAMTDISPLHGRVVTVDAASMTLTLTDITALYDRLLAIDSGTVAAVFTDVTLTYTPQGAYTLVVDPTSMALTLTDVAPKVGRVVVVDAASVGITAQDASLLANRVLVVDTLTGTVTLQDATLRAARVLGVDSDATTLVFNNISLVYSGAPPSSGATYRLLLVGIG